MSAINDSSSNAKQELLKHLLKKKGIHLTSETIKRRTQSTPAPLSFAEQRLWFLYQLEGENSIYNLPFALLLNGNLNKAALEGAIAEILRRHEVLRTRFQVINDTTVRLVDPETTVTLKVVDLQDLPEAEQLTTVKRLVTIEAEKPFDLANDPLVRVHMWRMSSQSHVLLINMHHIVSDAWSMEIFTQELSALYKAFLSGEPSPLPELPIQYTDFAVWQHQWLTGEVLEKQLDYWKQQLAGAPEVLALPIDRPRQAVQAFRGATVSFLLPNSHEEALKALSKRTGVTLFMTLYAAFVTLLYRYTGSDDIVVGTPTANRNRPEIEGLIGFFVNTLVLRTDLSDNPIFEDVLSKVRDVMLGAYAHTDLPFEKLVEELKLERDLSYTPLVQVMFVLNEPMPQIQMAGLTVSWLAVETATAKFDLTLSFENTPSGLIGNWKYNTDLFDASTIARMTGHFQTLLEGIVANPQQRVSQLSLLTERERHQLLVEWNNTTKKYPFDKCIHQLFEAQVERSPDAIAVVFEDKQLTYRELNQQANQLAHYLKSLGVGPEVLVGICVERYLEMVVGLLGILKAGGAYVPLDPVYPSERIAYILSDSQVPILLTQKKLVASLPESETQIVFLDTSEFVISSQSSENPDSGTSASNLAYMIYTSGSIGTPKGVLIPHSGLLNLIFWHQRAFNVTSSDRATQLAVTAFDASVWELYPYLAVGASIYLVSQEILLSLEKLRDWLLSKDITITFVPTPLAEKLLTVQWPQDGALRIMLTGGDKLHQYPSASIPFKLVNNYGPTENTVVTTSGLVVCNGSDSTLPHIGRPIVNTQIYILDRYLQPVGVGVAGELYIGGDGLARGYLNRPDLTQEKFIPNPFSNQPGSRLYKTGDKARYLSDGNIEFLGRIDNQVKIRGFRIELGEIEAALTSHPAVRETVVVAREDIPNRKYLAAYIVSNQSNTPIIRELRSFLKEKLPDYMIPGTFMILDALPLSLNGKVDRRALPAPTTSNDSDNFVLPSTSNEEILAAIWKDVLGLEKVGIYDNFFELGGDSIISLQIVARVNQAGLQITTKQLFQHQTIADLAAVASTTSSIKAEQGLVTGVVPLTPIQHWFFDQNWSEPNHFNQSMLLVVPPDLKPALLEQVVKELMVHHDALRMRFVPDESGWQQLITDNCKEVPFQVIDLSALGVEEHKAAIERIAAKLQTTLNLEEGPLLRVVLFNLGNDLPGRLLLIIHHLVVDGVSWRILLEDIATAYKQLEQGERIQLPPKSTSFKDWAIKQRDYGCSSIQELELDYWLADSYTDITPIPVDYPDGIEANTEASTAKISVFLNEEETRTLLQEVPSVYNTQINDVLLTALVQTFAQCTGSRDLLLELEGHGREELFDDVDLSRTVGWFTTIFPVLLQLGEADEPGVALKSIKEQLRRIPNRGIGYGILRYLSQNADIGKQLQARSIAEVCFNYLGQFDQVIAEPISLGFAQENPGRVFSPLAHRSHLLDVTGQVVEGKLQMIWIYSQNIHRRSTIERLATEYNSALKALIAHCTSPEAGGYTPTDFPLADLGQQELDELLCEIDN
jgi:amino acid adenylation domain-containing protein/non-ribosomal peptide synthase protein (TIGR01720 family)